MVRSANWLLALSADIHLETFRGSFGADASVAYRLRFFPAGFSRFRSSVGIRLGFLPVPIFRRASVSGFSRFRRRSSRGFPGSAVRIKGRYGGFVRSNYDVMYLHSNPRFLL